MTENTLKRPMPEVFDTSPTNYWPWCLYGCLCTPCAASSIANRLKIGGLTILSVGLMYWVSVALVETSLVLWEVNEEKEEKEGDYDDWYDRSVNKTEKDFKKDSVDDKLIWTLFSVGQIMTIFFGIWFVWLMYELRRTFTKKTKLPEEEASSCCYANIFPEFAFGQMGSHTDSVQIV